MMAVTMGYDLHIHEAQFVPDGTDLALCSGRRHVRVLTVPYFCGERTLPHEWNMVFHRRGDDQNVVWIPWDGER
jgi:hypothetical protein